MDSSAPRKPKALIWFESFGTNGPAGIVDRVAQALEARGVEVTIAGSQQSLEQHHFAGTAKLRAINALHGKSISGLKELIDQEQPDILITEEFPFISNAVFAEQLTPVLREARQRYPKMAMYSMLRDVPFFTNQAKDKTAACALAAEIYDGTLLDGDGQIVDFKSFFSDEDARKIAPQLHYLGYMVPPVQPGVKTKGGGVVAYLGKRWPATLKHLLKILPQLSAELQQQQWHFYLGGEPRYRLTEMEEHREQRPPALRDRVHFHKVVPDFLPILQAADLVISRGGGTAMDAAIYGKPSLIFSLEDSQVVRDLGIERVSKGRTKVLRCEGKIPNRNEDFDPAKTREAIENLFAQRRVKAAPPDIRIDGHNNAAQGMVDRLHGIESDFSGRHI